MLHYDRNIGRDRAGVRSGAGNQLRIREATEWNPFHALRRHGEMIRSHRITITVINENLNARLVRRNIQESDSFVTDWRNQTIGNDPVSVSDSHTFMLPVPSMSIGSSPTNTHTQSHR